VDQSEEQKEGQKEGQKLRLRKAFQETLSSDLRYNKSIEDIDYTVLTKAMAVDKTIKVIGCIVCMFNCLFEDKPAVLVVFSYYPKEDVGSKHISEKTIDIINLLQEVFITLDYIDIVNPKSEPYVYIVAVKKI
jgi:hypothetical protein